MNKEEIVAGFPGSFDPFTIGHYDIVTRCLPLFDRIVIGVGVNESKHYMFDTNERVARISDAFASEHRIEVKAYGDLTIDLAQREKAHYIIKGVRSVKDYEYELQQADINLRLGGIETLLLPARPELASISSSMVRELMHFGRDVTPFLPHGSKTH